MQSSSDASPMLNHPATMNHPTAAAPNTATSFQHRIACLEHAMSYYASFVDTATDYGFVKEPALASDPAARRMAKIAAFKQQKATIKLLDDLNIRLAKNCQDDNDDDDENEDELERKLILTTIELYLQQASTEMQSASSELDLLQHADVEILRDPSTDTRLERVPSTIPSSGPLINSNGKLLRPFVITSKRTELQQGVFRPGHSLPTMSLDEYLDAEYARGNMLSGGGKTPEIPLKDDLNETDSLAATYKARQWDDFKDDNPKGWGNQGYRKG